MAAVPMKNTLVADDATLSAETEMIPLGLQPPRSAHVIAAMQLTVATLAVAYRLYDKQQALAAKLARLKLPSDNAVRLLDILQVSIELLERRRNSMLGFIDCIESGQIALLDSGVLLAGGGYTETPWGGVFHTDSK